MTFGKIRTFCVIITLSVYCTQYRRLDKKWDANTKEGKIKFDQSIFLSLHLSVRLSVFPSFYLYNFLSVRLSVCLFLVSCLVFQLSVKLRGESKNILKRRYFFLFSKTILLYLYLEIFLILSTNYLSVLILK